MEERVGILELVLVELVSDLVIKLYDVEEGILRILEFLILDIFINNNVINFI